MSLRSRPPSIRTILCLLLIVVFLPVVLLQAWIYYGHYRARYAEELRASREVARAYANSFDLFVQGLLARESVLGAVIAASPEKSPADISALLTVAAGQQPTLRRFNWVSPRGRILASSEPAAIGINISFRSYLHAIRPDKPTTVSDLLIAVVDKRPTFTIATGIYDARKRLLGVLVGAVEPESLGDALAIRRSGNGVVTICDSTGRLVFRYPNPKLSWKQRLLPRRLLLIEALTGGKEVTGQRVSFDNVARMGSAIPIKSANWALSAVRPVADVVQPIERQLFHDFLLLMVVIAISMLAALWLSVYIANPLRKLQMHTAALARGELNRQVISEGPREVHELAADFQHMASDLHQRDREREVFLHSITHDLSNPLTAVLSHSEYLHRELDRLSPKQTRESLDSVIAETHRVNLLLHELLSFAQADTYHCAVEPVDLTTILDEFLVRIRPTLQDHPVSLHCEESVPPAMMDVWATERILQNLLINAVKFSPHGSPIILQVTQDDDWVVISVSDIGPGIPADEIVKVFDRFYRTRDVNNHQSLGLGLYIARRLVEAQGGTIWVESTPGHGSIFSFRLPAGEAKTGL